MSPDTKSYGQRMGQVARKAAERSGGGFEIDPAYYDSWWPKKDAATWVRLIPGEHENPDPDPQMKGIDPFFSYVEHRMWGGRFPIVISCKDRVRGEDRNDTCVGCYATTRNENISRSTKRAFSLVVLAGFHEVQKESNRGKAYTTLKQCGGRVCDLCKDGLPKQFGARRWWSVGQNHFSQLSGLNLTLGNKCHCGGRIERTAFTCDKGHSLLTVATSDKSDQQIEVFAETPSKCPKCGVEGLPKEVLTCDKKCKNTKRVDIFGVNLKIMTHGESTDSSVTLSDWVAEPIPGKYKGSTEPHDFTKMLAPLPAGIMAARLDIENPFKDGATATPAGGEATDKPAEDKAEEGSIPYDDDEPEAPAATANTKEEAAVGAGDNEERYE